MRKTKDDAERTCQSIMKCALNLFVGKGVATTNMEMIAKCANISRGAIYWHFKNKEQIIESLVSVTPGPIVYLHNRLSGYSQSLGSDFVFEILKEVLMVYSRSGGNENKVARLIYYKNDSSHTFLKMFSMENLLSLKCLDLLKKFYSKDAGGNDVTGASVTCAFFLWKAVLHENLMGSENLISIDLFEESYFRMVKA